MLDSEGFWPEMRYMVSWPIRAVKAGFTQHRDTREADPLLAGAPYKLIVIDEKKDVVLFEQRGFRGELAREVAKEWADEIRRIGAVKWVDPKTPGFDKAVPDRRM